MIGGFLGAGKTTAMLRLGRYLAAAGVRVGLVTNDQSSGLADTALASASGLPVEEITGGCFCCRFNSLMDAADRLTARTAPDVFIAEPVGSCTDLKATVSYPLRRMYGEGFTVAPFSVMVDPVRALRVLGLEEGRMFSPKVLYVYEKQLEEADIIVINKIDAVDAARLSGLRAALHDRYSDARVFEVSAKTGAGVEPWFSHVLGAEDEGRANLAIDYEEYAAGEALLGWLNCTARVSGPTFDGNEWVLGFVNRIQDRLRQRNIEIAHLKMTLAPAENDNDLAVANVVGTDARPATPFLLQDSVTEGCLIVNLRAEADPEILASEMRAAVAEQSVSSGVTLTVDHLEHFRPGRPVPTYRDVMA
jgi:Ni2+-binding GTPase involved in maturation of urease and hydrogenase